MEKVMPMNSCMEKAQPKVSEKWDFEYRDKSKLLSFFAFSDYQGLDARIKFNDFFYRIVFLKYRSVIWALDGRTKARKCGEVWFENKDVIIKNNFAIFGLPQTGSREKIQTLTAQCKLMAKTFQETGILCHQFSNETSVLYGFDKKTYAFEKNSKLTDFIFFPRKLIKKFWLQPKHSLSYVGVSVGLQCQKRHRFIPCFRDIGLKDQKNSNCSLIFDLEGCFV